MTDKDRCDELSGQRFIMPAKAHIQVRPARVIPAKAGISLASTGLRMGNEIPAFAGMTDHSFSVSSGTILNRSPTRPMSATWKIGASSSLLMATMVFESFIPARCWIAPEMPIAT